MYWGRGEGGGRRMHARGGGRHAGKWEPCMRAEGEAVGRPYLGPGPRAPGPPPLRPPPPAPRGPGPWGHPSPPHPPPARMRGPPRRVPLPACLSPPPPHACSSPPRPPTKYSLKPSIIVDSSNRSLVQQVLHSLSEPMCPCRLLVFTTLGNSELWSLCMLSAYAPRPQPAQKSPPDPLEDTGYGTMEPWCMTNSQCRI